MPNDFWLDKSAHLESELRLNPEALRPYYWGTVGATMFIGPGALVAGEVAQMRDASVFVPDFTDEDASNLIHQRYHFWRWERMNRDLSLSRIKTICEVGAGYGASLVVASRLGFTGDYYVHDLDVMHDIRERHLAHREVHCRVHRGLAAKCDLLVAICSLSEMPLEERDEALQGITTTSFLFAYNVDGHYFRAWAQRASEMTGTLFREEPGAPLSHLNYLTSYRGER